MLSVSELQSMRDNLIRARMEGALSVRFADGRSVTYRSDAEMVRALRGLDAMIAGNAQPSTIIFSTTKGLER